MIIRISRNFCHAEFEVDGNELHDKPEDFRKFFEEVYAILPGSNPSKTSDTNNPASEEKPEQKKVEPYGNEANKCGPAPTQRQIHYLRDSLNYTGRIPDTKKEASNLITKIEKNRGR